MDEQTSNNTLFIAQLPKEITKDGFKSIFNGFKGYVVSKLVHTRAKVPIGFVTFVDHETAKYVKNKV